jgi:hypothetical protein
MLNVFQQTALQECMRQPGCPVCRAVWQIDTAHFSWYVNDGVLDEKTRGQVKRSLGFCALHALALSIIEGADFLWSHLGSSMLYALMLDEALLPGLSRLLNRAGQRLPVPLIEKGWFSLRHLKAPDLCPLCFDHRQHEAALLKQFANGFDESERFRQAYLQAGCLDGLCVPHYQRIWRSLAGSDHQYLLAEAERCALVQATQYIATHELGWQRRTLALVAGNDALLWSEYVSRVALDAAETNPIACLACRQSELAEEQTLVALLDSLERAGARGGQSEQIPFSACSWHAWWLVDQCTRQPAAVGRCAPHLQRTCQALLDKLDESEGGGEQTQCTVCAWIHTQQARQVGRLRPRLQSREPGGQLYLPHARAAFQSSHGKEFQDTAYALLNVALPLKQRLDAYVEKCSERLQSQMQADERVAWFDALRFFVGSEYARSLVALTNVERQV